MTSKNEHLWHQIKVNFAKDYQKDSYNKTHFMGKKLKDKDPLTTLKKHSYLKICGILTFKKFKKLSKIDIKF
jgi:hypothetical protein